MNVDVREELENFIWERATWAHDKLTAASPFRFDRTPSFYVYLTDTPTAKAGSWGDPGSSDQKFARGGIVSLLSFLRQETTEETREYLYCKYGGDYVADPEALTLDLSNTLRLERCRQALNADILREYDRRHPYLESRGISPEVQRKMGVGYCSRSRAITIPWFLPDGTLGNVKFRRIAEKTFWYVKGGRPIREMIYGMNMIYRENVRRAVIMEAEIDAMYVMTAGGYAIANGSSAFTEEKAEIIRKSPLEEIVIMADHDAAGQKFKRKAIELLAPYMNVRVAGYPMRYKDPNDIEDKILVDAYINKARHVRLSVFFKV
nr:toprim domain-containing protein [Brevibacillus brevis]